jgi:hypothetical protein
MIKENMLELIFTLLIVVPSFLIYVKTTKMYSLSMHKGIKAFRNCFLFFMLAFAVRFIGIIMPDFFRLPENFSIIFPLAFGYFLSVSIFYLVYSLVWKEGNKYGELLIHGLAILVSVTDALFFPFTIYISLLAVIFYGLTISYSNYIASKKVGNRNFAELYLIALFVAFFGFLANLLSVFIMPFFPIIDVYVKAVTVGAVLIFFYGVLKTSK